MESNQNRDTPYVQTVDTAKAMSRLLKLSRDVTKVTLSRRLFQVLKVEKIGTFKLECEAINLLEGNSNIEGKEGERKKERKIELIKRNRDPEKVVDLIDLKLKYMQKEEQSKRKEYAKYKREIGKIFEREGKGKKKKFSRMIKKVAKDVEVEW